MNLPRKLLLSTALMASAVTGTAVARDVFAPAPPPPPFLRGLERVDLSDAQRQQIGGILDADRDASERLREAAREAREAFVSTPPGSAGYQGAAERFADAEAKAVRARILGEAQVRAKVYATLTEPQRVELAALPKPREPGPEAERGRPDRPQGPGRGGPDRGPRPDADAPPPPPPAGG